MYNQGLWPMGEIVMGATRLTKSWYSIIIVLDAGMWLMDGFLKVPCVHFMRLMFVCR